MKSIYKSIDLYSYQIAVKKCESVLGSVICTKESFGTPGLQRLFRCPETYKPVSPPSLWFWLSVFQWFFSMVIILKLASLFPESINSCEVSFLCQKSTLGISFLLPLYINVLNTPWKCWTLHSKSSRLFASFQ